jgi:hypothetical protein
VPHLDRSFSFLVSLGPLHFKLDFAHDTVQDGSADGHLSFVPLQRPVILALVLPLSVGQGLRLAIRTTGQQQQIVEVEYMQGMYTCFLFSSTCCRLVDFTSLSTLEQSSVSTFFTTRSSCRMSKMEWVSIALKCQATNQVSKAIRPGKPPREVKVIKAVRAVRN